MMNGPINKRLAVRIAIVVFGSVINIFGNRGHLISLNFNYHHQAVIVQDKPSRTLSFNYSAYTARLGSPANWRDVADGGTSSKSSLVVEKFGFRPPSEDFICCNEKIPWNHPINNTYLRKRTEIESSSRNNNCTKTLDVLGWLMNDINSRGLILMMTYGGMIHIHREQELVNKTTGHLLDDDMDMWASMDTVLRIMELEEVMFQQFGWSVRVFTLKAGQEVVLLQLFATCGHEYKEKFGKVRSGLPAIEVYPTVVMPGGEGGNDTIKAPGIMKDVWQLASFEETLVYPPRRLDFESSGTNKTLHLQLPNNPLDIMKCLYGNWKVPSGKHAQGLNHCGQNDLKSYYKCKCNLAVLPSIYQSTKK